MKTLDTIIPLFERLVKSNGFAIVVMFAMMSAMAYTLWNQYNNMNERLTKLEQEVI
jgi:Na+/H+ antiporter NhaC